jgi:hypothetical protein
MLEKLEPMVDQVEVVEHGLGQMAALALNLDKILAVLG